MDVLITGAGGRIGSHLARTLRKDGHRVRGLGIPGDVALAQLAEDVGVDAYEGDLRDPASLRDAVAGVDVVCHLAAALTTHDVQDELFAAVNMTGTFNLLAAVRDTAPDLSRFVYTSSDAVYWPGSTVRPLYLPVDEAHPLMAGSVYGATKVSAEAMCRAFHATYGIPAVVMRPTATASPAELIDPASPFGRRWFISGAIAWLENRPERTVDEEGLLTQLRDLVTTGDKLFVLTDLEGTPSLTMIGDARDVARGMRAMIEPVEAVGEAFNIGPEAPHSDRQFVCALGSGLGMEVVEIPYAGVRPSWFVSSAKARGVLGYRPAFTVFDMIDDAVAMWES